MKQNPQDAKSLCKVNINMRQVDVQMSFVIWMTGLPCSGKTTLARNLQNFIHNLAILDGDELREWLSPKDFSMEGRNEHNVKVAHLAKLLVKHNVPVCVSLVSPYTKNREMARQIVGNGKFIETYVKSSLSVCESRDVKGMYKKARNNEIKNFTGISDDYDIPSNPDLIIDSENNTVEQCVNQILECLKSKGMVQ